MTFCTIYSLRWEGHVITVTSVLCVGGSRCVIHASVHAFWRNANHRYRSVPRALRPSLPAVRLNLLHRHNNRWHTVSARSRYKFASRFPFCGGESVSQSVSLSRSHYCASAFEALEAARASRLELELRQSRLRRCRCSKESTRKTGNACVLLSSHLISCFFHSTHRAGLKKKKSRVAQTVTVSDTHEQRARASRFACMHMRVRLTVRLTSKPTEAWESAVSSGEL